MTLIDHPRYQASPMKLFMEYFILDVIGELPAEKAKVIRDMDVQRVFNAKASDWRAVVKETLQLSSTIEIAVLDMWYQHLATTHRIGGETAANQFAVGFTDQYFEDGSQIDIWAPGALDAAKKRISAHQTNAISEQLEPHK